MVLFGLPMWLMLVFLFVLGSVLGSFLNVCIYRIPQHADFWTSLRGLTHPPSSCPYCRNRIRAFDNIPIFGWLWLRGRCRFCRHRISWRYPAIELLNGLLFVLVYWFEIPETWLEGVRGSSLYDELGPQGSAGWDWLSPVVMLHVRYAYHMVLIEALVVATFIDFDLRIIPDGVTLPATAVGILGAWALGQVYLVPVWYESPEAQNFVAQLLAPLQIPRPEWLQWYDGSTFRAGNQVPAWIAAFPQTHGLLVSLAGLVVGGGIVWAVRLIGHWILRQEAMGFGDVILMAMIGSFLGWQPAVLVFFLAPFCALAVVLVAWLFWPQREIPYGPYLSLATLLVLLAWQRLWAWAEPVFGLGPVLLPLLAVAMAVLLAVSLMWVQLVKRLLGIELHPPEQIEEWTSADHLTYLSQEWTDPQQGQWPTDLWRGARTSGGSAHRHEWRQGLAQQPPSGWQQHWQRRNGQR